MLVIIFAPNMAVQSLEFDQKLCAIFTKTSHIFHIAVWPSPRFDLWLCVRLVRSHPHDRKVQNDVFPISIYDFNIYLFFKKRERRLLESGTS